MPSLCVVWADRSGSAVRALGRSGRLLGETVRAQQLVLREIEQW
jgi:hypothetical protein